MMFSWCWHEWSKWITSQFYPKQYRVCVKCKKMKSRYI